MNTIFKLVLTIMLLTLPILNAASLEGSEGGGESSRALPHESVSTESSEKPIELLDEEEIRELFFKEGFDARVPFERRYRIAQRLEAVGSPSAESVKGAMGSLLFTPETKEIKVGEEKLQRAIETRDNLAAEFLDLCTAAKVFEACNMRAEAVRMVERAGQHNGARIWDWGFIALDLLRVGEVEKAKPIVEKICNSNKHHLFDAGRSELYFHEIGVLLARAGEKELVKRYYLSAFNNATYMHIKMEILTLFTEVGLRAEARELGLVSYHVNYFNNTTDIRSKLVLLTLLAEAGFPEEARELGVALSRDSSLTERHRQSLVEVMGKAAQDTRLPLIILRNQ